MRAIAAFAALRASLTARRVRSLRCSGGALRSPRLSRRLVLVVHSLST